MVKRTELLQEQEAHELSKKNYHSLQTVHFSLEEELKTEKDNYLKINSALIAEQSEHKKTKEELALEKEKARKNQEKAEKDKIEAEKAIHLKAIHLVNEEKEAVIKGKNKAEAALDECKKTVDELKKQLNEKTSENSELASQIEEKNKQIKELQNNNDLISEETNKMRVFLENYKEYLYAKVQDADDTLSEEIFNEEQKQEIIQEKQEYEAKIVQVEQFIGKVNK